MDELEQKFSEISVEESVKNAKDAKDEKTTISIDSKQSEIDSKQKDVQKEAKEPSSSSKNKVLNEKKAKKNDETEKATLESIAELIKDGTCKNVIFMVGAGISTSVGIPDFRTKGSGLFDKLQKYNLPYKEAIFDIDYFRNNPKPFFALSRELLPGNFQPSLCHYFMTLFYENDRLLRCYTQNIDGLERVAGMPADKLVEAHGTFHTSTCNNRKCRKEYNLEWMKKTVLKPDGEDNIPRCEKCNSIVKPDITFYGEMLPDRFYDLIEKDFDKCDLLIILGTSLTVQPFASLAQMIRPDVKRLMINLTKPNDIDWDSKKNKRNVHVKIETDKGSEKLAEILGWKKQLHKKLSEAKIRIDKEKGNGEDKTAAKKKDEDKPDVDEKKETEVVS